MSVLRANFNQLVDRAMEDPDRSGIRPVIEKELLHYDILFILERDGFLKDLVFQGGTSLRLCHGSKRYSEDLDFVGGKNFSSESLRPIAETLQRYLGDRYGLEVAVKAPKETRGSPGYEGINVDRWQISVVTSPGRPDLPRQRIKLEIANVPAHDPEVRPLERNYDFLPTGYEDVLVRVESRQEILADKLVSFPVTLASHVRHRDIWDIQWLRQGRIGINPELVLAKVGDYRITDYAKALDEAIDRAEEVVLAPAFREEMTRFLPHERVSRTFGKKGFIEFMGRQMKETLEETRRALDNSPRLDTSEGFSL